MPVFCALMVLDIALGGFTQVSKVHAGAARCFLQTGCQMKNVLALDLLRGFALIARDICAGLSIVQFGFHKAPFSPSCR